MHVKDHQAYKLGEDLITNAIASTDLEVRYEVIDVCSSLY